MNFIKKYIWFFVVLFFINGIASGQNRLRISRQLQQSVTPYSFILTDASNNQGYITPGSEGEILTIVGGIPTWAGAAGVTASNGIVVSGSDIQLGATSAGSGSHDFTADRYLYFDTYDFYWANTGETALFYDNSNSNFTFGNSTTAHTDGKVWIYQSGASVNPSGTPHLVVQHSNLSTNAANIALVSGTNGAGRISFDDSAVSNTGIITYEHANNRFSFYNDNILHSTLNSDFSWTWDKYGLGTFSGTAAYNLEVDASGNIIETAAGGGGADGNGIYSGNGTVPSSTVATLTDDITFTAGSVFVQAAASGGTAGTDSDDLIVEGTGDNGITIFGGTGVGDNAVISMGSSTNNTALKLSVNGTSTLAIAGTFDAAATFNLLSGNGGTAISMDSGQNLQFNDYGSGANTGTATYYLAVTAAGNVIEESAAGVSDNIYTADGTLTADRTMDMSGALYDLKLGDLMGVGDELALEIIQAGQMEMRYLKGVLNSEIGILGAGTPGDIYINLQDGSKDNNMTFTDLTWSHSMDDGASGIYLATVDVSTTDAAWLMTDGATAASYLLDEKGTTQTGAVAHTGIISPAQITSDQNNYNPTGLSSCSVMRLDLDAARALTGILATGFKNGQWLTVINTSAFALTLNDEDGSSSPGNRFICPGSTNFVIQSEGAVRLFYDGTGTRWRVIAP